MFKKPFIFSLAFAFSLALTRSFGAEPDAAYSAQIQVVQLLKTLVDGSGKPLVYPAEKPAQVTAVKVEIPPGSETGWHTHPFPCFAYVLEGGLDVELASGEIKKLTAGNAYPEVVNILHNGKNRGTVP